MEQKQTTVTNEPGAKTSDASVARKLPAREFAQRDPSDQILQWLHAAAGNRAAGHWVRAKLKIGAPNDAYEQEADRVADQAVSMPGPVAGRRNSISDQPARRLQRKCGKCEEDETQLRRQETGAAPAVVPPVVSEVLNSPGQPLDSATRKFMEPRVGHDFSKVRIHTDTKAEESARAINARAYSVGQNIVFDAGEYSSENQNGRWLMAHELAHVAQQRGNTIARAVSPNYSRIEKNLTYRLWDWAITDAEAHEVLAILSGLGPADFRDTLNKMEQDGLLTRLLENVSDADEIAYAPLIKKIHQSRGVADISAHIESLMSYGLLDWAITDAEAHLALQAIKSLKDIPDKLRDVVVRIPNKQWERFFDNLTEKDRKENLRLIQDIEIIRSTGKTFNQLSQVQKSDLEAQAVAAGKTVGEFIRGEASARGYGGNVAVWWPSLLPAQKAAWIARFNMALAAVKAAAPSEIRRIISSAEAAGGGIFFLPEEVEELGPTVYGFRQGNKLGVGKTWVETAENDPVDVFDNIAHELGGHLEYGETASWDIMKETLAAIPPAERTIAESGPRLLYSAYQYMETEIYAELRELPYRTPGSQSDDPVTDVEDQLNNLKQAFASTVAVGIVRGMRRRLQLDSRITGAARDLFDAKVKLVFGITF